nr:MAG TPA: hypothetical protein [Caudoviricetes sp.]DAU13379.1 MAG TPA: hypothetical protein [Caudoviricetes sp.]
MVSLRVSLLTHLFSSFILISQLKHEKGVVH